MKQALRSMSLTLVLACAASAAWAGDRILISQESSASAITIQQSGNTGENMAVVHQSGASYGDESQIATIHQTNVYGSQAVIVQLGGNNQSTIIQRDGGAMTAEIMSYDGIGSRGNTFMIEQTGFSVQARIQDRGTSNSRADITQIGSAMSADIVQSGVNNIASITQVGSNLNASIMQGPYATNNVVTIVQRQ
ncbi:hypothetical protein [Massilia sp. CCM 8734]|uniref:hypothetical protein n=1 Tax=Massilia sp. CCM 8734 TaxID=2609283 RepID=UPI0014232626|nr:hypothetical protein [Massilia sp. CCM 8734]NHZ97032.1 hypothetical protein [Massilia sp. CCM 8734]